MISQTIKAKIASVGGDLTLLPIDQRDINKMAATIAQLEQEKQASQIEIERLSRLSSSLQDEKDSLQSRKMSVIEDNDKMVAEMQQRASDLRTEIDQRKASLIHLREKYDNLEGRFFHEQSEKQKLANILRKHMSVHMPGSGSGLGSGGGGGGSAAGGGSPSKSGPQLHSRTGSRSTLQMIPESTLDEEDARSDDARKGSGGGGGGNEGTRRGSLALSDSVKTGSGSSLSGSGGGGRSGGGSRTGRSGSLPSEDDGQASPRGSGVKVERASPGDGSGSGGVEPSDRDSLEAIRHRVMTAKKFQLKKGVAETIKAEGLKMSELQDLADSYDEKHEDFDGER